MVLPPFGITGELSLLQFPQMILILGMAESNVFIQTHMFKRFLLIPEPFIQLLVSPAVQSDSLPDAHGTLPSCCKICSVSAVPAA